MSVELVREGLAQRLSLGHELLRFDPMHQTPEYLEGLFDRSTSWRETNKDLLRTWFEGPILEDFENPPLAQEVPAPRTDLPVALKAGIENGIRGLEYIRSRLDKDAVFVVHGHANHIKKAVADYISDLGLRPVILHDRPNAGRTIIEKFSEEAADVGYAVIVATGDDEGRRKGSRQLQPRARQNVVLELGFFIGKLVS